VLEEEYTSDTSHQDGSLPYRMQITYDDGGPSYHVNEYFPHFHYQAGAALADENYDLLQEYWGSNEIDSLKDLNCSSELMDELVEEGAVESLPYYL
jgi:predicted lipid-binding transport protein (Tim44 family)